MKRLSKRLTLEDFKRQVFDKVGDEYTVLGEYVNSSTKTLIKHNICGHEYEVKPNYFLYSNNRCPLCRNKLRGAKTKTHDTFTKEVEDKFNGDIKVTSKYTGVKDSILVKHVSCGYEWETTPNSLLSRSKGCPKCVRDDINKGQRKTNEEFDKEIKEKYNGDFIRLSDYTTANEKINILHTKCGKSNWVKASHILESPMCRYCKSSNGEKYIRYILEENNIKFIEEHKFPELRTDSRTITSLRYDFYLTELNILIEYQGIQHFKPIDTFGGEERFKYQQEKDNIKRAFAKENNIKLIEIPYTYKTKEDIKKFLSKENIV